jgi:hypothetical protein
VQRRARARGDEEVKLGADERRRGKAKRDQSPSAIEERETGGRRQSAEETDKQGTMRKLGAERKRGNKGEGDNHRTPSLEEQAEGRQDGARTYVQRKQGRLRFMWMLKL